MLTTAVDLLLVILLLLTSVWCVLVHRRLVALKAGQTEIAAFVEALTNATAKAEQTVAEMRAAGSEAVSAQGAQQDLLKSRREELVKLNDNAQRTVRRLEDVIGRGTRLLAELRTRQDMQAAPEIQERAGGPGSGRALPSRDAVSAPPKPDDGATGDRPARPRRRIAEDLLEALQKLR